MNAAGRAMVTAWHAAMSATGQELPDLGELLAVADQGSVQDNDSREVRRWKPTLDHLLKQAMFGVVWEALTLDPQLHQPLDLGADAPSEPDPEPEEQAGPDPEPEAHAEVEVAPESVMPALGQEADDIVEPAVSAVPAAPKATPEADSPPPTRAARSVPGDQAPATDGGAVRGSSDPRVAALQAWRDQAIADGRLGQDVVSNMMVRNIARGTMTSQAQVAERAPKLAAFAEEVFDLLSTVGSGGSTGSAAASTAAAAFERVGSGRLGGSTAPATNGASSPLGATSTAGGGTRRPADPSGAPFDALEAMVRDVVIGQLPVTHKIAPEPASGRIDVGAGDEGPELSWIDAGNHEVTVYRIVLGDGERPLQPEDGETLALTSRPRTVVERVGGLSVLAHLQVWAYRGELFDEAVAAQPTLIAERSLVRPVSDVQVSAETGWVNLSWTAPDGASAVRVYRYSGDRAPKHDIASNLVGVGSANLTGLSDAAPATVPTFVYRAVVAVGTGDATQLSDPVDTVVSMPTRIEPVTDLEIVVTNPVSGQQPGLIDLRFLRPSAGKVWIYRLTEPLVGGVAGRQFPVHALPSAGLTDERRRHGRLGAPDEDGRVTMEGLQWPAGEPLLTFVPVTVLGEDAAVGTPVRLVGIGTPGDPRLRDRVHEQVITFGWPAGATEVLLFPANSGDDPAEVVQGRPAAQIDEIQYERDGGWRLQLTGIQRAQDFLLVGIKGTQHRGAPARVTYEPLLVLEYALATGKTKAMFGQQRTTVAFWRRSGEATGRPPFVLVHNPTRLPLMPTDGTPLPLVPDATPEGPPSAEARPGMDATSAEQAEKFRIASTIPRGYLRAFLSGSVPVEVRRRVALLDPPVESLRIRG